MYKIYKSCPLNDFNLIYEHSHLNKILNYLKQSNAKEFYVFSSEHKSVIFEHNCINFFRLSKSYERKIRSVLKIKDYDKKAKMIIANTKYYKKVAQKKYIKILNKQTLEYQYKTIYKHVRHYRLECPFQTEYRDYQACLRALNVIPYCKLDNRLLLIEQFTESMRQASYNAKIHSENKGIVLL